jgi:TRAP-type mannitol/chloroaromatic compound transport system permease large subunit
MLGLFIFVILLGFPIAFTLMGMAVGFGFYAYYRPDQDFFDSRIFYLLTQNTWSIMSNDVLVAVPLFLFMGYVVERSNILDKLFYSLQVALRHIPGSMAVAALLTCAMFATATGIVGAVVTLMGLLAFPRGTPSRRPPTVARGRRRGRGGGGAPRSTGGTACRPER